MASGKHNVYETTTTTDVTQEGTGNGHMLSKSSSTTSTTSTEHQQTFDKVNVHASTTDLPATPATAKEAPTAAPLCGGATFSIADAHKTLCLHVKGGVGAEGRPAVGELGFHRLDFAPRFRLVSVRPLQGDTVESWTRQA